MSLNLLSYASLLNMKVIGKSTNSNGGIEGSMPWPVGGWGYYRLVSELLLETLHRYGLALLVRFSWSRSNSNREFENLRRNFVAEAT
jgi:hypothetical protein